MELAWPRSRVAPFTDFPPVCGVLQDTGIAVAICDESVSIWSKGEIGGTAKRTSGHRYRLNADGQPFLTGRGVFNHLRRSCIERPDVSASIKPEAVGNLKVALAPGPQKGATLVEDQDRIGIRPTLDHVDVSGDVDCYARDCAQFPTRNAGV